jgi:hypothetical protein
LVFAESAVAILADTTSAELDAVAANFTTLSEAQIQMKTVGQNSLEINTAWLQSDGLNRESSGLAA